MPGSGGLARVDMANDHNVDVYLLLTHSWSKQLAKQHLNIESIPTSETFIKHHKCKLKNKSTVRIESRFDHGNDVVMAAMTWPPAGIFRAGVHLIPNPRRAWNGRLDEFLGKKFVGGLLSHSGCGIQNGDEKILEYFFGFCNSRHSTLRLLSREPNKCLFSREWERVITCTQTEGEAQNLECPLLSCLNAKRPTCKPKLFTAACRLATGR
ncbi:hypothetical protein IEQ34_016312 [Dendrobium chrysotoxum]|uniref:Uncharacterized protein n=1 Tax=Dendrobium chrysotoxum TaxID=161865 RepID=A0AAV7GF86_DENCH|nr:hypothetical protein IEQ34_016312 [Dendrobium chrysotoxum]